MKSMNISRLLLFLLLGLVVSGPANSRAGSLYDWYVNAAPEALDSEVQDMGREISLEFDEISIEQQHLAIEFSEYYSNFHKMIFFAGKLANYGDYQSTLTFARDKEIFKGLPEEGEGDKNSAGFDRKKFVKAKYQSMEKDTEAEIETYRDMILTALDTCEATMDNSLSGSEILARPAHRRKIERFMEKDEFGVYRDRRTMLAQVWPELASRISGQISLWQEPEPAADAPLIDPLVTKALLGE